MTGQKLTTRRITGFAGLGVAVLFGVGSALWAFEQPEAGASTRAVVAFYTDNSTWIVAGLSLLAIPLFVFFASGVRAILREHEGDDLLATAAFGGALGNSGSRVAHAGISTPLARARPAPRRIGIPHTTPDTCSGRRFCC